MSVDPKETMSNVTEAVFNNEYSPTKILKEASTTPPDMTVLHPGMEPTISGTIGGWSSIHCCSGHVYFFQYTEGVVVDLSYQLDIISSNNNNNYQMDMHTKCHKISHTKQVHTYLE